MPAHQRVHQPSQTLADWHVLVSFSYVHRGSAHTTCDKQPRSRTLLTYTGPCRADLESVLAMWVTPRYESGRSARISDGNRDGNDGSH